MDSELLLKFIGYFLDYLSALSSTLLRFFGPLSKQLYTWMQLQQLELDTLKKQYYKIHYCILNSKHLLISGPNPITFKCTYFLLLKTIKYFASATIIVDIFWKCNHHTCTCNWYICYLDKSQIKVELQTAEILKQQKCIRILQRLPITCDLWHSKESDKVVFWWTSIKEKPLKLFWILTRFQGNPARN